MLNMNMDTNRKFMVPLLAGITSLPISMVSASQEEEDNALWGAAVIIIELTDNDIELQVFADAFDWTRMQITDPRDRRIYATRARGKLRQQGGMSELFFASEPSHYLVDEENYDESVDDFLRRWPEGSYEFEGLTTLNSELSSEAYLSHILPALPEIVSPISAGEEPPVVNPNLPLLIDWEPVTTRYMNDGPVEIFEYQVIVVQEEPAREMDWIDGDTRRSLINLPPDVTEINIPPEILIPGALYEIEILAIESSGNSTISVTEFVTSD